MKVWIIACIALCGCASHQASEEHLTSLQIIDRNGFSETVSAKNRIETYEKIDFLANQPYQKVLRVYSRGKEGRILSKITSYHPNGQIWQYLETENGRAHGDFKEWHSNGQLKVQASVIEGVADITETAQLSWLFNGMSRVWDEEGRLIAEIPYEKGLLEGEARYYFATGNLSKSIPYRKDTIDGAISIFDASGAVVERMEYQKDLRHGLSSGPGYLEQYQNGLLIEGTYSHPDGSLISKIEQGFGKQAVFKEGRLQSLIEFQNGKPEGKIEEYNSSGSLSILYHLKDGKKHGEEWEYYSSTDGQLHPKLCLSWIEDAIQGVAKTWYETGVLESQREMHGNKKHGLAFAWYKEGDLMLMEEYENGLLIKGSYFKKWETRPVSRIERGQGIATLYTPEGNFLNKISYEKGAPLVEKQE